MEAPAQSQLCHPCLNLNLRIEIFVETSWRFPTSFGYETIDDIFSSDTAVRQNDHVLREFLDGDIDYSSERLSEKLRTPLFVHEFHEDGVPETLTEVSWQAGGCAEEG